MPALQEQSQQRRSTSASNWLHRIAEMIEASIACENLGLNSDDDRSLWIFAVDNPIRRMCQLIVAPSWNDRLEGTGPNLVAWCCFSAIIYASIVCIVILTCIATPLYRIEYFTMHGGNAWNWIIWSDIGFAVVFSLEALIKNVADGFLFTPNAYLRNVWNDLDFFVLLTIWATVITELTNRGRIGGVFRAIRALRALRLVSLFDSTRHSFHDIFIRGFWNILSATVVTISFLVPYAIWSLNIFKGLMFSCNDNSDGMNRTLCAGEYTSSPGNWNILTPRSWTPPAFYNFDNFGSSLATLFEIVSQEGWTIVMTGAMAIVGPEDNPRLDASPWNAVFFIIFNLLGSIFVITLFISVIIINHTKSSGDAYLTVDQRSWKGLREILLQLRPSARPADRSSKSWRGWCYDQAINKRGYWSRCITGVYVVHLILLMAEIYPSSQAYILAQNYVFFGLSIIYVSNIILRMTGLGTYRYFRSGWDLYDMIVNTGSIGTTIVLLAHIQNNTILHIQKLFLIAVVFNLIPRNEILDEQFKASAASVPTILSLLRIWLVFYVIYGIAFTQIFGLTRLGPNGTGSLNFRTMSNALIVLFRMSVG